MQVDGAELHSARAADAERATLWSALEEIMDPEVMVEIAGEDTPAEHPPILSLQPLKKAEGSFPRLAHSDEDAWHFLMLKLSGKVGDETRDMAALLATTESFPLRAFDDLTPILNEAESHRSIDPSQGLAVLMPKNTSSISMFNRTSSSSRYVCIRFRPSVVT